MILNAIYRFARIAVLIVLAYAGLNLYLPANAQESTEEVPPESAPEAAEDEDVPVIELQPPTEVVTTEPPPTELPPTQPPPTEAPPSPEVVTEVPAETATVEVPTEVATDVPTQEVTEPPTQEVTETPTSEVTPELTAEAIAEATIEVTPEVTAEATLEATAEVTAEATQESTEEALLATGLGRPVLTAPANKSFTNRGSLTFTWNAAQNATRYDLQIATSSRFTPDSLLDLFNENNINGISYTINPAFGTNGSDDGRYFWRVIARDASGQTRASVAWSFTLDTIRPAVPVADASTCNITIVNLLPVLKWDRAEGATGYQVRLYTAGRPAETVTNPTINGRSYRPPAPLLATSYRWAVRAVDDAGNVSNFSSPECTLNIESPSNASPILSVFRDDTPTIRWGDLSWDRGYQVEISNSRTFRPAAAVFTYASGDLPANTTSFTAPRLWDGVWYARVRARKENGRWSGWSAVATFVVDIP